MEHKEALRRLLARCPAAAEEHLVQKALNEDDAGILLSALHSLLLQPAFTLPTITIFRSDLLSIVASLVEEVTIGYRGGAEHHPAAVAATLIRVLVMAPHLEREVLRYLSRVPGPHCYLFQEDIPPGLDVADLARCTLFGLEHSQQLREQWRWPDLLPMLAHSSVEVRWCGARSLAIALGGGETLSSPILHNIMTPEEAVATAVRWQNACAHVALEKAAALVPGAAGYKSSSPSAQLLPRKRKQPEYLENDRFGLPMARNYVELCGLELPCRGTEGPKERPDPVYDFVLTSSMHQNVRDFALGLCISAPILVEGPPSCGKSVLIRHVAGATRNERDLVTVYLDDQTDSKTLLGAYICTSKPGEFVWQQGPLTQAVTHGSWLLIENINLASAEVLATLLPLVERRTLYVPSRGEEIQAAIGFQLIATITTDFKSGAPAVRDMLGGFFHTVRMGAVSATDRTEIASQLYPILRPLVPHAMLALELMNTLVRHGLSSATYNVDDSMRISHALAAAGLQPGELALRLFSFRDILKWAHRMARVHAALLTRTQTVLCEAFSLADIPVAVREAAFLEFIDCMCMGISRPDTWNKVLTAVGTLWAVPLTTGLHAVSLAKPKLELSEQELVIGRAQMPRMLHSGAFWQSRSRFAMSGHAMRHLERVSVAATMNEPVLLVGETGTGKTTLVQELASHVGAKLVVVNVSQQTDSADLIGGFRPLQPADAVVSLTERFVELIRRTWTRGNNEDFVDRVTKLALKRRWRQLVKAFRVGARKAIKGSTGVDPGQFAVEGSVSKKARKGSGSVSAALHQEWAAFSRDVDAAETTATAAEGGFAFGFSEGALVKAVREGWWLLLDEINLAPPEALERISGLMDDSSGSITITERGDEDALRRHRDFRLFAAMNPATDAGKRDLPNSLRSRFTELWIGEPHEREDLAAIVAGRLLPVSMTAPVDSVVDFYVAAKEAGEVSLQDGAGHKPTYNLRTLSHGLEYAASTAAVYSLQRALYDGLAMSFLTQLDVASSGILEGLLQLHVLGKGTNMKALMNGVPPAPGPNYVLFDHYWVEAGDEQVLENREDDGKGSIFVATPTVMEHLRSLARAVLLRKYPVLLQGPTSSGKTSLVAYLAAQTGHHFVRINNHEQTDLQEYLGTYVSDEHGRLIFQEGVLVQAVRNGHWIVLDELNLAPTEVLEALNRLLDDNRELFVPELQEVVKPHPHFMLFATQNPPGLYAGRKTLSRAFRSRFLELHIDDIPDNELHVILERRCAIAPSYAAKLVAVMRELQRRRAVSNVFAGRHGYITPRDLFRWAGRGAIGYQELAENGFALLGERLRGEDERRTVFEVLHRVLKVKVEMDALYQRVEIPNVDLVEMESRGLGRLIWTKTFRRMYWLLDRCLRHGEPALLIGETGLGKTSVCQLAACARGQRLTIINCNRHSETSDFLGGYRPNRNREYARVMFWESLRAFNKFAKGSTITLEANEAGNMDVVAMHQIVKDAVTLSSAASGNVADLQQCSKALAYHFAQYRAPFEWVDGPLVRAMKNGDVLLIDELNLAEDAVLERLNSVLEPNGTLTLAEKGGRHAEVIKAHPHFRIIGTMNPGGDYGKKELSPALSNRFTTIWVPSMTDTSELREILMSRLQRDTVALTPLIIKFWEFYKQEIAGLARQVLTVRDLLTWVDFINVAPTSPLLAYVHGAHIAFLDGIGLGVGLSETASASLREKCFQFLGKQLPIEVLEATLAQSSKNVEGDEREWGVAPFLLPRLGVEELFEQGKSHFDFNAPTSAKNTFKLLRALQLKKPVLLEGSPGVGKTSLVSAVSNRLGHRFVRINLSEQTDMMDLLGADLPVESGEAGEFAWSDGPLLHAIKSGAWVLLDELNLANQSVLEGLNALLDHRAEVFIPELNATYKCAKGFRIFGSQNPLQEGGGRKGLPKSFLNRFSRVYMDPLRREDLLFIGETLYPRLNPELLDRMVSFLEEMDFHSTRQNATFGVVGGPWEFNVRDLLRWCESVTSPSDACTDDSVARHYADMLFTKRVRTPADRVVVRSTLAKYFTEKSWKPTLPLSLGSNNVKIGYVSIGRKIGSPHFSHDYVLLPSLVEILDPLVECVSKGWMCLLVGSPSTGKTAAIRALAQLCGQEILELPLNAGTDTSDILGGFEQVDLQRKKRNLFACVQTLLDQALAAALSISPIEQTDVEALRSLATDWSSIASSDSFVTRLDDLLDELEDILGRSPNAYLGELLQQARSSALAVRKAATSDGRFEWVDGSLTRAIIEGRWVILDNANLCNPSVLDRLNSLLEPNGVLYLNECGEKTSGSRVLVPHKNFRLFLTLDPKYGEVSRAMRNRGMELFLLPDQESGFNTNLLPEASGVSDNESGLRELEALLGSQGIVGKFLQSSMAKVHSLLRAQAFSSHRRPPTARDLQRWGNLVLALSWRGIDSFNATALAFESVYVQPMEEVQAQALATHIFGSYINEPASTTLAGCSWFQAAYWPIPLTAFAAFSDFRAASALRDVGPVLHWVAEVGALASREHAMELTITPGMSFTEYGLPVAAVLPGDRLSSLLLGIQVKPPPAAPSYHMAAITAIINLRHAIQIFMERSRSQPSHQRYADLVLSQCKDVWDVAMPEGQDGLRLRAILADCVEALRAFLSHANRCNDINAGEMELMKRAVDVGVGIARVKAHTAGDAYPTWLGVSCWRYENPALRGKVPIPHPIVDWLWPFFASAQVCLTGMLAPSAFQQWTTDTATALQVALEFQRELWAFFYMVHGDPWTTHGREPIEGLIEDLVFVWMRLRDVTRKLVEARGHWAEGNQMLQAAARMDETLGLQAGQVPPPLLWARGGRPLLPQDDQQSDHLRTVDAFCKLFRVDSADGYSTVLRSFTDNKALCGALLDGDLGLGNDNESLVDELNEMVIASVVSNVALRREVMAGAELVCAAALMAATEGNDIVSRQRRICSDLEAAIKHYAKSVADKALVAIKPGSSSNRSEEESTDALCTSTGRSIRLQALGLFDIACGKQQLAALSGMHSVLTFLVPEAIGKSTNAERATQYQDTAQTPFGQTAEAVADSGCRDLSEGIPYMLLKWSIEARKVDNAVDQDSLMQLQQSMAHEAWFKWHRALWCDGIASSKISQSVMIDGPKKLHTCALTAHVHAITSVPQVPIYDRSKKLAQLQLVGDHLRRLCADKKLWYPSTVLAEWRAAALITASTLYSYLPVMHEQEALEAIIALTQAEYPKSIYAVYPDIREVMGSAVKNSSHGVLRQVGMDTLLPALELLSQEGSEQVDAEGMVLRGQIWALLGLGRLQLSIPPPGADPARNFELLRAHICRQLAWDVEPELLLRKEYAALPTGPSESDAVEALLQRKKSLEAAAAELQGRSPFRPTPPQYLNLRGDATRFSEGIATIARVKQLSHALNSQQTDGRAVHEARSWVESARAAVDRLATEYPLYRDIVQPLQLAVYETCYGIELSALATERKMRRTQSSGLEAVAAHLMTFPRRVVRHAGLGLRLESAEVQQVVAATLMGEHDEKSGMARQVTGITAKLELMRITLAEAVRTWRSATTPDARRAAHARLYVVFDGFLRLWEIIKEEEARVKAEEAELFKVKTRTLAILSEEEEAEKEFKVQFPDRFAAYSDLMGEETMDMDKTQEPSHEDATSTPPAAAVYAAKDSFLGDILREIVAAHSEIFCGPIETVSQVELENGFLRSYELGMRLVGVDGGSMSARLDDSTLTGHLYAASLRGRGLVSANRISSNEDSERAYVTDIQSAAPEEAVLIVEPLSHVRARVKPLLAEWPDHPVLGQLDAICARILGMSMDSPLKLLLTGLELLLARAQVWEDTAAKHVSLASELAAVAALARRWRQFELESWRMLLQKAVARAQHGAELGWFHMLAVLMDGNSLPASVAVAMEEFMQASPLGEYKTRLELLWAFKNQLLHPESGTVDVARRAELASVLHNVYRYYAQFLPSVEIAIVEGMKPLEKDLEDFVKLAKWEDRGYYAMKAATEKAQRHLHKLSRRAMDLLRTPASTALLGAVKTMGLDDLKESEAQKGGLSSNGAFVIAKLADFSGFRGAIPTSSPVLDIYRVGSMKSAGKYTKRLPSLTSTFEEIVRKGVEKAAYDGKTSALHADDLAATVAERALQLRTDVGKGAKARKKKALVDYFKALTECGVSKLRNAVPAERRTVNSYFALEEPKVAPVLDSLSVEQGDVVTCAWNKAEEYYYGSLARLQRLMEASKDHHNDLSSAEVTAAQHFCEHLIYLTQLGREELGRFGVHLVDVNKLLDMLSNGADLGTEGLPSQTAANLLCREVQDDLAMLSSVASETEHLLMTASKVEAVARQPLLAAAQATKRIHAELEDTAGKLRDLAERSFVLDDGRIFITPALCNATNQAGALIQKLSKEVRMPDSEHAAQPGWFNLCTHFTSCRQRGQDTTSSTAGQYDLANEVEAMVEAALLWAQSCLGGDANSTDSDDKEEEVKKRDVEAAPSLPVAIEACTRRLGIRHLSVLLTHATRALECIATLSDTRNDADATYGALLLSASARMLTMLRAAALHCAALCLVQYRSLAKLTYITTSLFSGIMKDGFCMPEGSEEGEMAEGEAKEVHGTGLGDGDTRGAKDISDELEDEDQLLGAQQQGVEEGKDGAQPPETGQEGAKGIEMDDDFEGALEDVPRDAANQEGEDSDEADDEDGERLDQQMGDVGEGAEDVDEKLWGGDDDDNATQKDKEEAGHDTKNTLHMEDTSMLDYAQGQEDDEGEADDRKKPPTGAPEKKEEAAHQQDEMDEGEEEEAGDYTDRPEDRGNVHLDAPEEELQLPEDLKLDEGEQEEEDQQDEAGGQQGEDNEAVREEHGRFPEQPETSEGGGEEDLARGADEVSAEEEREDGEVPQELPQTGGAPLAGEEEQGGPREDVEESADRIAEEHKQQLGVPPETNAADGDKGDAAATATEAVDGRGEGPDNSTAEGMQLEEAGPDQLGPSEEQMHGSTAGAAGGMQNDAIASRLSAGGADHEKKDKKQAPSLSDANPFRNLGNAMERWLARLAIAADAPSDGNPEAEALHPPEEAAINKEEAPGQGEYRFLGMDEAGQVGDTQVLAGATENQAGLQTREGEEDNVEMEDSDAMESEEENVEEMAVDGGAEKMPPVVESLGQGGWGTGAGERAAVEEPVKDEDGNKCEVELGNGDNEEARQDGSGVPEASIVNLTVASRLQSTRLDDQKEMEEQPLTGEYAESLRRELDRRLLAASAGQVDGGDEAFGREVWSRCEALTGGLVGELTEQLRLVLEPTLASKLGGEYRTGKRINMKRVIGYIASHFRKDKIWMRRTRPDKRQYQVLVAVDNSRSMAENGFGSFATEAVALLCRAMARLEVGQMGVVSFGGSGGALPLHPLEKPFTDVDGVRVMSHLRFDQDNTINDRPMVDVITSLDQLLEGAGASVETSGGTVSSLHQLVLIIADGRFHEKEALRRAVRDASSRPGVLYAFIILDSATNSILDMQSVSFADGNPVFTKYMDSFPFPYYIVLRETAALPRTLADLLRQWFELQSSG